MEGPNAITHEFPESSRLLVSAVPRAEKGTSLWQAATNLYTILCEGSPHSGKLGRASLSSGHSEALDALS